MGEIEAIFAYWQEVMSKPRAKMDSHRRKAIVGRMNEGYSMSDLCDAINGCAASEFHMGGNDRQTRYNDITLILRDASHVDQFIERWEQVEVLAGRVKTDDAPSVGMMTADERKAASARMRELIGKVGR